MKIDPFDRFLLWSIGLILFGGIVVAIGRRINP